MWNCVAVEEEVIEKSEEVADEVAVAENTEIEAASENPETAIIDEEVRSNSEEDWNCVASIDEVKVALILVDTKRVGILL